jgi:hypothetical protein
MTDLRKAAEMALEALEELAKLGNGQHHGNSDGNVIAQKAIPVLRQALAQPEQEPNNWWDDKEYVKSRLGDSAKVVEVRRGLPAGSFGKAQPEQEPADLERIYETIIQWDENGGKRSRRELAYLIHALYTAPSISEPLANQELMFWYRPLRDGMYEGPIHNNSVLGKMLRNEKPNEWKPLYTALISEPVKERISEPLANQEPVAWMFEDDEDNGHKTFQSKPPTLEQVAYLAEWKRPAWTPLYTAPPKPAQSDNQEPAAKHVCNLWINPETSFYEVDRCTHPINEVIPVYTAPPKREWVGLTDEERNEMIGRIQHDQYTRQRDLINSTQIITEMYLKEKNGG